MAAKSVEQLLKALDLTSAQDALFVSPIGCTDLRTPIFRFAQAKPRTITYFRATIAEISRQDREGKPTRSPYPARADVELVDESGWRANLTVFGAPNIVNLASNDSIRFIAKVGHPKNNGIALFLSELVDIDGYVRPDYAGVRGQISKDIVREFVQSSFDKPAVFSHCAQRILAVPGAASRLSAHGFGCAENLLRGLHRPQTSEECHASIACAADLSADALRGLAAIDHGAARAMPGILDAMVLASRQLPGRLTGDQRKALWSLSKSFSAGRATRTLLHGDVGTGKTWVYLVASVAFARLGLPSVVLAPNAPLSAQIIAQVRSAWPDVDCGLCTASIKDSNALLRVGTTALLGEIDAADENYGILIVDEQHKFSVGQRSIPADHVIEVSATPIPRTLALAETGGWSLIAMKESPVPKTIRSHILAAADRSAINALAAQCIQSGKRVVYVYPLVQDGPKSVISAHAKLDDYFKAHGGASLLHGQMSDAQKNQAVADFKAGATKVLVCTTAAEVGLDVSGIGLMVVIDPHRYGASQLHQMRGRLARDGGQADFIMYTGDDVVAPKSMKRLEDVRDCQDGLELSRRDLDARGIGALVGAEQSGRQRTLFLRQGVSLDGLRASA